MVNFTDTHTHCIFSPLVQFMICTFVTPWNDLTLPPGIDSTEFTHVDKIKMGKALLESSYTQVYTKVAVMKATPDSLEKLAQTGNL